MGFLAGVLHKLGKVLLLAFIAALFSLLLLADYHKFS